MRTILAASIALVSACCANPARAVTDYGDNLCQFVVPLPFTKSFDVVVSKTDKILFYSEQVDNQLIGTLTHLPNGTPVQKFDYPFVNVNETLVGQYDSVHEKSILTVKGLNWINPAHGPNPWFFRYGFRVVNSAGQETRNEKFIARCKFNQFVRSPVVVLDWSLSMSWQ